MLILCACVFLDRTMSTSPIKTLVVSSANYPWCSLLAWFWDQLQTKFNRPSIYEWYQNSSAHAWDIFEQKNIAYVPAVHFDCLDIRDGGSIKRTCNCTYWCNCKIWFSFIAARNNFFGAWNNFWQLGVHGRWSQIDCSMVSSMQMLANKCNKNKLF